MIRPESYITSWLDGGGSHSWDSLKKWAHPWSLAQEAASNPSPSPHSLPLAWEDKGRAVMGKGKKDSQEQYKNKALVLTQIAMATDK